MGRKTQEEQSAFQLLEEEEEEKAERVPESYALYCPADEFEVILSQQYDDWFAFIGWLRDKRDA